MRLLATMAMALLLISSAFAQDPGALVFGGATYDKDDGIASIVGAGKDLGSNIWTTSRLTIGTYGGGALETDLLYGIRLSDHFVLGLVAGPGVDWFETEGDPISYMTGSAGTVFTYQFTRGSIFGDWGVFAAWKYKFGVEGETLYQDGYVAGLGLAYAF